MQLKGANCVSQTRQATQHQAVLERSRLIVTSQLNGTNSWVDPAVTIVTRR